MIFKIKIFYNLQRLDLYDNGHTYNIIYDICVFNNNNTQCSDHLCNNNGTNNGTLDCTSGVKNGCSGTIRYGNNDISFINIYGVSVVNLAYDFVALVVTLESISSSCEQGCLRLSSDIALILSFSSKILRLISHCGCVCLEHVPIALLARLETIYPLSSPSLSPILSILCTPSPGLYSYSSSSHTKCPHSIPFLCQILNLVFGPSITPTTCYFTRHIYKILFLPSTLNPVSLILMIIFMTMGFFGF